ncbi:MAG: hypothetical protein Q3983_01665 [Capnocytophaga sp.]|nr:hypothetical protein [Capnocytophaga sp.]
MERKYTSLQQIEDDLKILRLKKEIDWVCLKSDYQSFLRNLSVKRIFFDTIADVKESFMSRKKGLLAMGVEFLLRRFLKI